MSSYEQELEKARKAAAEAITLPAEGQELALFRGMNFRINIVQLVKAAYHSTMVVFLFLKTRDGIADPVELLQLPAECAGAFYAALAGLRKKMSALQYVVCLVLSQHEHGLTPDDIRTKTQEFIDSGKFSELPWLLRIPESELALARDALKSNQASNDIRSILRDLHQEGVVENSGVFSWTNKVFTLGTWEG